MRFATTHPTELLNHFWFRTVSLMAIAFARQPACDRYPILNFVTNQIGLLYDILHLVLLYS
ncbi:MULTISPECIES: hypothetical protein [Nostoc]|uniref:Transposase n=1 Tax=Nostoc paludosum FACHB-159 TaxID=2692908 RepID=A0ABR8KFV9_9NOSO|nr:MULTISPECIES: hypothetical protein [Nostoc]MBD2681476.1 hypothetical protein [Nostoc sp. FACHB-857]MBD2737935.1 hypothetical protein [Nostoc paludosum FACHB-159]